MYIIETVLAIALLAFYSVKDFFKSLVAQKATLKPEPPKMEEHNKLRRNKFEYGILPNIAKPSELCNRREYRQDLAKRCLRTVLWPIAPASPNGSIPAPIVYDTIWALSIEELVHRIAPPEDLRLIVKHIRSLFRKRGVPLIEPRISGQLFYITCVTREQYDLLVQAIAESKARLYGDWNCKRMGVIFAPHNAIMYYRLDMGITRLEWAFSLKMLGDITELKIRGNGDISALDEILCSSHFSAIEQTLVDTKTLRYEYVPNTDGCFTVRIYYRSAHSKVLSTLESMGFEVVSSELLTHAANRQRILQSFIY